MAKNKDIKISPSKGISIVIKNDFQPPAPIPKKKRKYKRKVNTMPKMPTMPSFIPTGDVSYIKPQYSTSSLNRNMIFPGTPQSLPQLMPPPPLPQLMAPPQQPVNISFDNMFGNMLENALMPREYGFKPTSYIMDMVDDDVLNALPEEEQDRYIEKKLAPQVEQEMQGIEFADDAAKLRVTNAVISAKKAREYGTKHANKLLPYDGRYNGNEDYKNRYVMRLHDILNNDTIKTKNEKKVNTTEHKTRARQLLRDIGIEPTVPVAP